MGEAHWWRSPRLVAAAGCFVLGVVVLLAGFAPRLMPAEPDPHGAGLTDDLGDLGVPIDAIDPAEPGPPEDLVVYVSGAVVAPEVYRLPAGARVKDAVLAAGGLRPDAAAEQLNLAAPVEDAQHVHVPSRGEPGAAQDGGVAEASNGLLNLNHASAAELEELPGVGVTLAERIIRYREEQGPFTSVETLREVSGIGERLFAQIAPLVTAGP